MYDWYFIYNKVLKAQLFASVYHLYIDDLHDDDISFALVTIITILPHIQATYGVIEDNKLGTNLEIMPLLWSPPTPIEILFT